METTLEIGNVTLSGDLIVPESPTGIVIFAHGSGSGRHSPRNRFVASALHSHGLATLLFDLLTTSEERRDAVYAHLRFDIDLLAERLLGVTEWVRAQPGLATLPIGYFGASTGAAAALSAAAQKPERIAAIVSRGGRPDLAGDWLSRVRAPTLLIVGGADPDVLQRNRAALARLTAPGKLVIVPGATHLFEEEGALEQVAHHAADWFATYLGSLSPERRGLGDAVC
jgi:alpha-beta hydrolase superfamily lysophospholipase